MPDSPHLDLHRALMLASRACLCLCLYLGSSLNPEPYTLQLLKNQPCMCTESLTTTGTHNTRMLLKFLQTGQGSWWYGTQCCGTQ